MQEPGRDQIINWSQNAQKCPIISLTSIYTALWLLSEHSGGKKNYTKLYLSTVLGYIICISSIYLSYISIGEYSVGLN